MKRTFIALVLILCLLFTACGGRGNNPDSGSSSGGSSVVDTGSQGGSSSDTGSQGGSSSDTGSQGGSSSDTGSQGGSSSDTGNQGGSSSDTGNSSTGSQGGQGGDSSTALIDILSEGCGFESIYLEWAPVANAQGYSVYCDGVKVDKQLIRKYSDRYRVDVVGITASEHTVKVLPVIGGEEVESASASYTATPPAHVREGFAFSGGYNASGAYNKDGTLKAGAQVVYVTKDNAKTVTANVNGAVQTGLQTILDAKQKANTSNDILCIRVIGMISLSDLDHISSSAEGLQIKGRGAYTEMNITFEGIGNDATINGFGFLLRNCKNVEIRNIGIINFMDDGISVDTDNSNLWLHNIDFFYGNPGGDADQDKGDGSLDIKKSQYITVSYNHFWESGKSCLLDASTGSNADYISYHHNWFDHSDSRHPRVRNANVHVYNNYYDGVAKYGIGAAGGGSSVFSEANYFRNTKCPMLTSKQGSDISADDDGSGTFSGEDGGVIKSFGDVMVGNYIFVPYSQNNVEYDAYVATSRNEVIPASVVSKQGKHTYSNFDTASDMYQYTPHTAEQAKDNVMAFAGRVQGGDLKWTFTEADDTSYAINAGLKAAVTNYKPTVILSNDNTDGGAGGTGSGNQGGDDSGNQGGNGGEIVIPEGGYVQNFTTDGKASSFFSINGNLSAKKGTVTYNGLTLSQCLKIETSTNISFTISEECTLILVFGGSTNAAGKLITIDGEDMEIDSDNILTVTLGAGTHVITKRDSINLFYIVLTPAE